MRIETEFEPELEEAIRAGEKRVDRRPIDPQPVRGYPLYNGEGMFAWYSMDDDGKLVSSEPIAPEGGGLGDIMVVNGGDLELRIVRIHPSQLFRMIPMDYVLEGAQFFCKGTHSPGDHREMMAKWFRETWDSIHFLTPFVYDNNPMVWVREFEVVI